MIGDRKTSRWREEEVCKGTETYLDIDTFAFFDRSAIFPRSTDLRYVTFAGRHSMRNYPRKIECKAQGGCLGPVVTMFK